MTKNNLSVSLTPEFRLIQAFIEAGVSDVATVTKLTVAGYVSEDDVDFIRDMMGNTLHELDLSNASIIRISDWAFEHCVALKSVILPNMLKIIDKESFHCCSGLVFINIPNSVIKIEKEAFMSCSALTEIVIPESMIMIGDYAFWGCGLTSVTIPASLTKIGNDIFRQCSRLTEITVHPDNPVFASQNGVLFSKDMTELITYPQGRYGDYVIPDSVIIIRASAFNFCAGLTSVVIPNKTLKIGDGAFSECSGLTSVIIPDSVVSIGNGAFRLCTGLTSVKISESVKEVGYMVFRGCTGLTSVIIPNSVIEIYVAFYLCTGLTSIDIPKSTEKILWDFETCSALISINVHPDNDVYSSIDGVLFSKDKTELIFFPQGKSGDYVIPETVLCINREAFGECTNLTSVTIPESVIEIDEEGCIYSCSAHITVHPQNPVFESKDGKLMKKY